NRHRGRLHSGGGYIHRCLRHGIGGYGRLRGGRTGQGGNGGSDRGRREVCTDTNANGANSWL
ncbi:hypothetical protein N8152_00005, partial [bacterium]|nr:hypothetical protein [bacterium]